MNSLFYVTDIGIIPSVVSENIFTGSPNDTGILLSIAKWFSSPRMRVKKTPEKDIGVFEYKSEGNFGLNC